MKKTYTILETLYEPTKKVERKAPEGVWLNKQSELVENCGVCNTEDNFVELSTAAFAKIEILMRKFPDTEWLAYLKGRKVKDKYAIQDLLIPKQQRSTATVDLDEEQTLDMAGVIGTIHSHHSMGAFFSGTDDNYIAPNYPVSIIVATSGWACKIKQTLPCGHFTITPAKLVLPTKLSLDMEGFTQTVDANVTLKVSTGSSYEAGTWKGFTCKKCGMNTKDSSKVTWAGGMWLCKPCATKKEDAVSNKATGGIKFIKCDWCQRFVAAEDTINLNESTVCEDCFSDSRMLGLG